MGFRVVVEPEASDLEAAMALRRRVFVDEQNVPEELESDGLDATALHAVVWDEHDVVATGRVLVAGSEAKMQRVAVAAERRRQGLGREVMRQLEEVARRAGARSAKLASQVAAIPFYEALDYVAYGEVFMDAGIEHRWMSKPL